ncbi:hypothetical protein BGZ80_010452, partial [Entomortierella chlamydospora]
PRDEKGGLPREAQSETTSNSSSYVSTGMAITTEILGGVGGRKRAASMACPSRIAPDGTHWISACETPGKRPLKYVSS